MAAKKAAAPKKAAKKPTTKTAPSPSPSALPSSPPPPSPSPSTKAAKRPPVEKTRVVVPMDVYDEQKDAVKAPLKDHAMKWNFLGQGKGLYKREDGGIHCFVQFQDDGVHYSLWGDDKQAVGEVLAAWRSLLGEAGWAAATASGEAAVEEEKQEAVSDAMRLWKMGEPQPRPGEPDFFFKKRVAEWQAKKPAQ